MVIQVQPQKPAGKRVKIKKLKWNNSIWNLIKQFFVEYGSVSTIHGLGHVVRPYVHPLERLLWICIIGAGVYGAFILSSLTLARYYQNPTVISMERDRFSWNTSFPASTICPTFKVNEPLLEEYVEKSDAKNKTYFKMFLISLLEATYTNFEDVLPYDEISPDQYLKIILELQFEFKPSVTNSGLNGKQYYLTRVVSEIGICYSFNSHLAIYNSPEYWESGAWNLLPENETFYVNPLDGEVFANVINMSTGFKVYIHGPHEIADISSKNIESPNGYFLQLYLTGLTLFSSDRTRYLQVNQRKCRFHYESDLRHSPVYSYVLCRMECRLNLAKRLCGCIPHFYRVLDGERICDVSGLHCLSKFKERLILLKGECSCLANCDDVNYVVEDMDTREWFLGSNLQWGLKEYPKMRLKRDVLFGFSDLLVYIGGMAGLFLGCSVLSFVEIIYFFTLRLYWFLRKHGRNNK